MAKCKLCAKFGFFLKISTNRLCQPCEYQYLLAVRDNGRIMQDCLAIINTSGNYDTRMSRCDLFIEKAQSFLKYERIGIHIMDPAPSVLIQQMIAKKHEMQFGPGCYNGKHYTGYVDGIKSLKRSGLYDVAEEHLVHLIDAVEGESAADGCGVAPWYYDELAKLCRRRKDLQSELAILIRYQNQRHVPGAKSEVLDERLEKVRIMVAKASQKTASA